MIKDEPSIIYKNLHNKIFKEGEDEEEEDEE